MFRIEMLYPQVANLYGDHYNIEFLKKSIPDAEIIRTGFNDRPAFTQEKIDFLYMGPIPEPFQEHAIETLKPWKNAILERLAGDRVTFFTGNAFEILGEYIEKDDGSHIDCLGLYKGFAKREMFNRYNSLYLGKVNGLEEGREPIEVIGFKTQFTKSYNMDEDKHAFETLRELDIENTKDGEGVRIGNFFGTYLLGPLLVNNPLFAKYLIELAGGQVEKLAHEDYALECYYDRLKEFQNPAVMMN